jgi:hypothetical protein
LPKVARDASRSRKATANHLPLPFCFFTFNFFYFSVKQQSFQKKTAVAVLSKKRPKRVSGVF